MAPTGVHSRGFTGRLLVWHAFAVLAALFAAGVTVDRVLEGLLVDRLTDSLISHARLVQATLPDEGASQDDVVRLGQGAAVRISLIGPDGSVLADSERDPAGLENDRDRPEVRAASSGEVGVATRPEGTDGIVLRFVALPPQDGVIVRVAEPLTGVRSDLRLVRWILVAGFGLAALAGLLVEATVSRGLTRSIRTIAEDVGRIGRGDSVAPVPPGGSAELDSLVASVNEMMEEVAARVGTLDRDRRTRDAVLAALEEGVILFDVEGNARYHNDRATSLLGSPPATTRRLAPPALRGLVERAKADRGSDEEEVTTGPPFRTLRATALHIPEDGSVLLVLRDVTAARTVDAIRRDFVANASHELKTPVASIQALAETIEAALVDDPKSVPRFSEQLERESRRLSRIISDLLDLSRLEGQTGERAEVRFDRLVLDETSLYRERAERAGLSMVVDVDGPVRVNGSARDLGLMVRNLVENAIQYTRPEGKVGVTVSTREGRAVLEVRDSGIGIPARDRARVFERFYRVDRARSRETGGTGLGLSIVKHVAENHGGAVSVRSELGRGSAFTVLLPLAP